MRCQCGEDLVEVQVPECPRGLGPKFREDLALGEPHTHDQCPECKKMPNCVFSIVPKGEKKR